MHDTPDNNSWIRDEHLIFFYTFFSIAIVLSGHRTWQNYRSKTARRARIHRLLETSRREKERTELKLALSSDALNNARHQERPKPLASTRPPPPEASASSSTPKPESEIATSPLVDFSQDDSTPQPTTAKRSKERRKRGRDVCKDVLRQGRSKASALPPPSVVKPTALLQVQTTSESDISRSRSREDNSRSSSRAGPTSDSDSTEETPRPRSAGWTDRNEECSNVDSQPYATESNLTHAANNERAGPCHADLSHTDTPPLTRSGPSTSSSASISSVSISAGSPPPSPSIQTSNVEFIVENGETSISITQPTPLDSHDESQHTWLDASKRLPETFSFGSGSSLSASDASWDGKSSKHERHDKSQSPNRAHIHSRFSNISLPISASLSDSSPSSTPPPHGVLKAQLRAYRNTLESSQRKEENYSKEIERLHQECNMIRHQWEEDMERAHLQELELQTQLHHVTNQLHALSYTLSQMQMQHYYSVHPHAQQSQPVLGTYPMPGLVYGYTPPPSFMDPLGPTNTQASPRVTHPFLGTMPHMDSCSEIASNTTSPNRESTFNTGSSLYDTGSRYSPKGLFSSENDDEVSEELAEAILKHPESIRFPSSSSSIGSVSTSRSNSGSRSTSIAGRASREALLFASLSELGNPQHHSKFSEHDRLEHDENSKEADYTQSPNIPKEDTEENTLTKFASHSETPDNSLNVSSISMNPNVTVNVSND